MGTCSTLIAGISGMAISAQTDRQSYKIAIGLILLGAVLYAVIPRNADLRAFNPQRMAQRETEMWRDYYDKHYLQLFWDVYASSRSEFRFSPLDSFRIALAAAHAARLFQPTASREEASVALPPLEVYYGLLRKGAPADFNPGRAAELELDWWQARRESAAPRDYGKTIAEATSLVYGAENPAISESGLLRAEAMAYRDARSGKMTDGDWRAISSQLATAYGKLKEGIARR
jgi:hypothetical protein